MKTRELLYACVAIVASCVQASPIGLVLSGGGAKGAYEVGVWQAFHEAVLAGDVAAISGTSIGAVNAALFASWPDPKGAERLWLENLGKIFVPNDHVLEASCITVGLFDTDSGVKRCEHGARSAECLQRAA